MIKVRLLASIGRSRGRLAWQADGNTSIDNMQHRDQDDPRCPLLFETISETC